MEGRSAISFHHFSTVTVIVSLAISHPNLIKSYDYTINHIYDSIFVLVMISRIGHLGYNIGQLRLLRLTARNRNYYETLGISRDATEAEIKKAYKDLARKYHPDRPDGNNEIFLRVQEANETLSSALKRAEYDRETFGESIADAGTDGQSGGGPEMGAFVGKKKGGTYHSPEYVDSLRKWEEWKERYEETAHR